MKNIKIITTLLMVLGLNGCFLKPHRVDVQQGNIISTQQIAALRLGMPQDNVRFLLGDPILDHPFDKNLWTYVYTNQINGGKIYNSRVTLFFKNSRLASVQRHSN